ncbi:UDP-N-acetylmuramoyl-L-alanyl-D-glutamate--2,6-diaminopimelate ligase [Rickettsia endosymbiont of Halotydeus destructor]|uniref:UDP-N-acetylmuramoyl-L-alanyl-D-glutamate--2, 6-diaminopimelate ligase n=1 Tax=Rickettsia endosymbiont of Halotydeus destructor TaxID=2996754 RepID=UPI003BAFF950
MPHSSLSQKLQILFKQHNIASLSVDSRSVKENEAFFATKGENYDGNKFISDALNNKAGLIITDNKESLAIDLKKIIYVADVKAALYESIEYFYPNTPKIMIAATGTNGKSSVVSYIAQLYSLLGENAASIGTLGVEIFGYNKFIHEEVPKLTTPDYLTFRKIVHKLAENEIECLAFEASSHGLDQNRLGTIKVQVACFTSFSQDHLDYHQTKEAYLLAKLKLFTDNLLPQGIAVLNSDIAEIDFIKDYLKKYNIKSITIGSSGSLKINKIISSIQGQNINFTFNDKDYEFNTEIIGSFQASNLLIAAIAVHNTGFAFDKVISALAKVNPVKGRMERIENTNIFIDYAHTPDALEKTLSELKNIKLKGSKLIVIFGCGGNRDKTKRSLMGEISAGIADKVIITNDNPRNENPGDIRKDIISSISNTSYIEIADREEAIKYGINNLGEDDILLIAGKGHENYQIIGDKKLPFDDIEIAKKYL